MAQEIGSIIRDHRKRLGLTLLEMEKRTGINNGNLSKIERGLQSLTNDTMKVIAKALGISLSDLFSEQRAQGGTAGKNTSASKGGAQRFFGDFDSVGEIPEDEFVALGTIAPTVDPVRGGMKIEIDKRRAHFFIGSSFKGVEIANMAAAGVLEVGDDAMEPRLYKSDVVVVDVASTAVPATGGVFCVSLDGETLEFRRLMPYPGKGLRIMCDNTKYPEVVLDHRQAASIEIVGRAKLVSSVSGL